MMLWRSSLSCACGRGTLAARGPTRMAPALHSSTTRTGTCRRVHTAPAHGVAAGTPDTSAMHPTQPSTSGASTPASSSSTSSHADSGLRVRFRRCRMEDVPAVAAICGQAFGFGNFPGINNTSLNELEERYAVSIEKEVIEKLAQALNKKAEAQIQHREYRLQRQAQWLRAQLAALEGKRASYPGPESPEDLRRIQKWRRARMYVCLLAIDADSGEVLGCVTASLMQPEAVLPPPLPSNAPLRFYCSNMAVSMSQRRRGLAGRLLTECGRIGRLWGWDSMWLHVSILNTSAQSLYQKSGFRVVNAGLPFTGPLRQVLMCKQLPPAPKASAPTQGGAFEGGQGKGPGGVPAVVGGKTAAGGVFVWQATAAEGAGAREGDAAQMGRGEVTGR